MSIVIGHGFLGHGASLQGYADIMSQAMLDKKRIEAQQQRRDMQSLMQGITGSIGYVSSTIEEDREREREEEYFNARQTGMTLPEWREYERGLTDGSSFDLTDFNKIVQGEDPFAVKFDPTLGGISFSDSGLQPYLSAMPGIRGRGRLGRGGIPTSSQLMTQQLNRQKFAYEQLETEAKEWGFTPMEMQQYYSDRTVPQSYYDRMDLKRQFADEEERLKIDEEARAFERKEAESLAKFYNVPLEEVPRIRELRAQQQRDFVGPPEEFTTPAMRYRAEQEARTQALSSMDAAFYDAGDAIKEASQLQPNLLPEFQKIRSQYEGLKADPIARTNPSYPEMLNGIAQKGVALRNRIKPQPTRTQQAQQNIVSGEQLGFSPGTKWQINKNGEVTQVSEKPTHKQETILKLAQTGMTEMARAIANDYISPEKVEEDIKDLSLRASIQAEEMYNRIMGEPDTKSPQARGLLGAIQEEYPNTPISQAIDMKIEEENFALDMAETEAEYNAIKATLQSLIKAKKEIESGVQ